MSTIIEFLRMVEQECGGSRVNKYRDALGLDNQIRKGQAFMNALRGTPYYGQISGSLFDPFFLNNDGAILAAIDYVTKKAP